VTLRTKLLLAQAPLAAGLALVGLVALNTLQALGEARSGSCKTTSAAFSPRSG
jgi:hypothetical protein